MKQKVEAAETVSLLRVLEETYIRSRPAANMDDIKAERARFTQNRRERGNKYVEEYNKRATHLLTKDGYGPLTLQEKADIVKTFGFKVAVLSEGHHGDS